MSRKISLFVTIVLLIVGYMSLNANQTAINNLEIEIAEQESQIEKLLRLNRLYEELIALLEESDINLNHQIEILEEENKQIETLKVENEELRIIRTKLTAYSPLDDKDGQQSEGNPSRTSIGKKVSRGIVAADPKKLPYGTKLEIPGWGIVEVGDTGGALRKDNKNIRLDLFHETYKEAISFGVKNMDVKILEWGNE